MRRKWLRFWFYVLAISLLSLTLSSCGPQQETTVEFEARITAEARGTATSAAATVEVATAIAGVQTYEAGATAEAEATAAAQGAAPTEPALEITKMATKVLEDDPEEGVANIDFIFTVEYATAGHTAFLVCYEENVESERTAVSGESGTSEVIVHLVDFDYYGPGQAEPFCELRDASSREVLAEAYPGPHTAYAE
jgi:hypothetical protein